MYMTIIIFPGKKKKTQTNVDLSLLKNCKKQNKKSITRYKNKIFWKMSHITSNQQLSQLFLVHNYMVDYINILDLLVRKVISKYLKNFNDPQGF